jgi:hypothetical protein
VIIISESSAEAAQQDRMGQCTPAGTRNSAAHNDTHRRTDVRPISVHTEARPSRGAWSCLPRSASTAARSWAAHRASEWSSPRTRCMRVRVSSASWRDCSCCPSFRRVAVSWVAARRMPGWSSPRPGACGRGRPPRAGGLVHIASIRAEWWRGCESKPGSGGGRRPGPGGSG